MTERGTVDQVERTRDRLKGYEVCMMCTRHLVAPDRPECDFCRLATRVATLEGAVVELRNTLSSIAAGSGSSWDLQNLTKGPVVP